MTNTEFQETPEGSAHPMSPGARELVSQLVPAVALMEGRGLIYTATSAAYRKLIGRPDPVGQSFYEVMPELVEMGFAERLKQVLESGESMEGRGVAASWDEDGDGEAEHHFIDYTYQPIADADGEVRGVLAQITDRTEQIQSEQSRDFLARASDVLASSLDYDVTLSAVTRLAVQGIADWCAVDELTASGEVRRIAVAHPDPAMVELAHRLNEQYPPDPNAPRGVPQVLRTGEPEIVAEISDELLVAAAVDEEQLRIARALKLRSYIVVPLIARGRVLGALSLISTRAGRRFGERDLRLAEELARRAAVAIDNARLFRDAEEARMALEEQASELEAQTEELQHQAAQLEEIQAELEVSNADLEQANFDLVNRSHEAHQARVEAESTSAILNAFFNAAPVAAGYLDRDLRYRRINKTLASINGVDPAAVIGRTIPEAVPRIAAGIEPLYRRVLETGEALQNLEMTAPRAENPGAEGHYLVNYFPVSAEGGRILGVGMVAVDFTDAKRAEERERAFAQMLEESRYEIYIFDAQTLKFQRVNRGGRENLGFTIEELHNLTPLDIKPEFDPDSFGQLVAPLRSGHRDMVRFETVHRRKDGSLYPVDVHLQLSTTGEQPVFVAFIVDDTDRKEAERAAHENAERLRAVVGTAVDGIITVGEDGVIETVNPAMERIFGYRAEKLVGQHVSLVIDGPFGASGPDRSRGRATSDERIAAGEGPEVRGLTRDGRTFPLELTVSETTLGGRRIFTGIVRDITERRRAAEELLAAKEAAEQANTAKSQFLTVMSHELRTPLNAIMGYEDLLEAEVVGPVNATQKEHLGRIKAGARQLLELINQILSLARIEAGKEVVDLEPVDAAELASETLLFIEPLVRQKGLELRSDFPQEGLSLVTDAGKVRQILLNLLGNAVKFTDEGEVALSVRKDRGWVEFRIRDTGPGIDPRHSDRIFEPFIQVDLSQTRRYGGTGLGLAVSRELARLLGGDLRVASALGEGSTFTLTLPAG